MNPLFAAAVEVESFFRSRGWSFCIIGGLAVLRWGKTRATVDVDVSLLTGFNRESEFIDEILSAFRGRLQDARQFAIANRVLLIEASNGVAVDVALAAFPFEEGVIRRASLYTFAPGAALTTASADDLVVMKSFAGREQDWADVIGIVERQGRNLDWSFILREINALQEMSPDMDIVSRLKEIRKRAEATQQKPRRRK